MLKILSLALALTTIGCLTTRKKEKTTPSNPPNIAEGISLLGESVISCDNAIMAGYHISNFRKPTRTFFCGKVKVPMGDGSDKTVGLTYIYFPPANFLKNPKSTLEPVVFADLDDETAIPSFIKQASSWNGVIDQFGVLVVETRGGRYSDPFIHCKADNEEESLDQGIKNCANYWKARFPIATLNVNQVTQDLLNVTDTIGVKQFYFLSQSPFADFVAENLSAQVPNRLKAIALFEDRKRLVKPEDTKTVFTALASLDKHCKKDAFCKNTVGPLGTKLSKVLEANAEFKEDILDYIEDRFSKQNKVEDLYIRLHDFSGGSNWRKHLEPIGMQGEEETDLLFFDVRLHYMCDILASRINQASQKTNASEEKSVQEFCSWQQSISSPPPPPLHDINIPVLVAIGSLTPLQTPKKDRLSAGFRNVRTYEFDSMPTLNLGDEACQTGVYASFFQRPDLLLPPCRRIMQFEPLLSAKKLELPTQDSWYSGEKDGAKFSVHKSSTHFTEEVHIRAFFWQLYKTDPKILAIKADPGPFYQKIWSAHMPSGKNVAIASISGRNQDKLLVALETDKSDAVSILSEAVHAHQREINVYAYLYPFSLPGKKEETTHPDEEKQAEAPKTEHQTQETDIYAKIKDHIFPMNVYLLSDIPDFEEIEVAEYRRYKGSDSRLLYRYWMIEGHEEEQFRYLRHEYGVAIEEPLHSIQADVTDWEGKEKHVQIFYSPVHGKQDGYLFVVSEDQTSYAYFSEKDELDFFQNEILSRILF